MQNFLPKLRFLFLLFTFNFSLFAFPPLAYAHAFGQLYNLPVPFWMYLYGGAAAIVLSFLIIGYFVSKKDSSESFPTWKAFYVRESFIKTIRVISLLLFLLVILAGFVGENSSYTNFNMNFFWIIFLLGVTYGSGLFGNFWEDINPLKTIASWISRLFRREILRYPQRLGFYPALILYFLLIWIELFVRTTPFSLSLFLSQYLFITIVGVVLFGKEKWFMYGEFFSVFFRMLGKMGMFEKKGERLYFRPPFVGLLNGRAEHVSLLFFILFMLSSTAFDGFRSTATWYTPYWQYIDPLVFKSFGLGFFGIFETLGLLFSPFLFFIMYVVCIYIAKVITKSKLSLLDLLLQFAFSLIPIAFVYNIAHYYTLLITEGQNMLRLVSDPFGYGWDLFGTRNYFGTFIPDANFIWHSQVGIILLGHVVGVYIAHRIALRVFPNHKNAMLSQLPVLLLMVVYTMVGLWILSQPITSG